MVKIELGGDQLDFIGINDVKVDLNKSCSAEENLMWSSFGNDYTKVMFTNSIIGTIFTAWNAHYNLVLDPDSVWLAICLPFSKYIYNNSEDLRKNFVDHEEKKELKVDLTHIETNLAIESLVKEIANNIKDPDFVPLLESNFTTTNIVSKNLSKLGIMKAMANYFSFKCCACCGLKSVELTGTRDDWIMIKDKVDAMKKYDVDGTVTKWTGLLNQVIDKFIEAFDGVVDSEFWNKIALESMGSGSSELTGWLVVFNPYSTNGRYLLGNRIYGRIDSDDVCGYNIEVDMDVDDNGYEYKSKLRGGFYGCTLSGETISPKFGYGMYRQSDPIKVYEITNSNLKYVLYENGKYKQTNDIPDVDKENISMKDMYMKMHNATEYKLIKVDTMYNYIIKMKIGDEYVFKSFNKGNTEEEPVLMSNIEYVRMYLKDIGEKVSKVHKYEKYRTDEKISYSYNIEFESGKFLSDFKNNYFNFDQNVVLYLEENYNIVESTKSDFIIYKMKVKGHNPVKILRHEYESYDYKMKNNVMRTVYAIVFSDGSVCDIDEGDYSFPIEKITDGNVFYGLLRKTGNIY